MPSLEFKGKSFIYTHHLGVPYRELNVVPEKSSPAPGKAPDLDDNLEARKALLPRYAGEVALPHTGTKVRFDDQCAWLGLCSQ